MYRLKYERFLISMIFWDEMIIHSKLLWVPVHMNTGTCIEIWISLTLWRLIKLIKKNIRSFFFFLQILATCISPLKGAWPFFYKQTWESISLGLIKLNSPWKPDEMWILYQENGDVVSKKRGKISGRVISA